MKINQLLESMLCGMEVVTWLGLYKKKSNQNFTGCLRKGKEKEEKKK